MLIIWCLRSRYWADQHCRHETDPHAHYHYLLDVERITRQYWHSRHAMGCIYPWHGAIAYMRLVEWSLVCLGEGSIAVRSQW